MIGPKEGHSCEGADSEESRDDDEELNDSEGKSLGTEVKENKEFSKIKIADIQSLHRLSSSQAEVD